MFISNDIKYIGVSDRQIDFFEGQYAVPNGMSYNSYVILDEKVAVLDTADQHFTQQWFDNLEAALCGRQPDYLVVHHMEPDHSANIALFMQRYPAAQVVSSAKAFAMMKNFFGTDYADRRVQVGDGSTLSLGRHTLVFVTAPMVHWPEVILSYDSCDKILFSADTFGKFGTPDTNEPWEDEARRYYIGIVGKYGAQVQLLLKKLAALDIHTICPLHGPVLTENIPHHISLYDTWSSYRPETSGVVIAYSSVYGHTKAAALELHNMLAARGETVEIYDLARCDMAQAIAAAFRYDRLVLATTTYNAEIFPCMHRYIHGLVERGFRTRTVALIENGSWAPMAAKVMRALLDGCKDLTFTETTVKILSALSDDSRAQLTDLCDELCGK